MELSRTKTYTIKVDDNNKCSSDCNYIRYDSYYKCPVCILELCTTAIRDDTKIKRYERTEYCKKFFENKEFKQ